MFRNSLFFSVKDRPAFAPPSSPGLEPCLRFRPHTAPPWQVALLEMLTPHPAAPDPSPVSAAPGDHRPIPPPAPRAGPPPGPLPQLRMAIVIDLDVHQGNGTAACLRGRADVITVSLHQLNNYPWPDPDSPNVGGDFVHPLEDWRPKRERWCNTLSDLDVGLPDGCGDAEYLAELERALRWVDARLCDHLKPHRAPHPAPGAGAPGAADMDLDTDCVRPRTGSADRGVAPEPAALPGGAAPGPGPGAAPTAGHRIGTAAHSAAHHHVLHAAEPQVLVVYVAGADPYVHDPLGGIDVTQQGLRQRDRAVFRWCHERGFRVCVVLAGGYASSEEVATIHFNTFQELMRVFEGDAAAPRTIAEAVKERHRVRDPDGGWGQKFG